MPKFTKRVKHYLTRRMKQAWSFIKNRRERKELLRMTQMERHTHGTCYLLDTPIHFVDAASCVSAWREIWVRQSYQFDCVSKSPRIIDCGANIGLATLFWKRAYPEAKVTAFEPDPAVFNVLKRNCQSWGYSDVEVVQSAVWTQERQSLIFEVDGADAGRLSQSENETNNTIKVSAVRLRDYLEQPVDMLKVDIEGAECDVIQDCESQLQQVQNLFVEFHSFTGKQQKLEILIRCLANAGFRLHLNSGLVSPQPFLSRRTYHSMDQFINIYAFRPPS